MSVPKHARDIDLEAGARQLTVRFIAIVIASVVGALVGLAAVGFFGIVAASAQFWKPPERVDLSFADWQYSPVVGLCLLVAALLAGQILRLLDKGRPHGPADLIYAAQHDKPVDFKAGFLSSFLALVNLSGGASVGIFGPLVHFGGCLSGWLQRFSTRLSRDVVLGCGAGAAIAAVFSAPIGAAIYAHESIIRRFGAFGPGPVLACTFAAYWVSEQLLGDHRMFAVTTAPVLNSESLSIAVMLGLAAGGVSTLYIHAVTQMPKVANASGIPLSLRPLLPAAVLFLISPLLPQLLGTGLSYTNLAMAGQLTLTLLVVLVITKIAMTSFCLGFGFFGGVFAPALFFGTMLGAAFDAALLDGAQQVTTSYAALGAAACVATVIGAPIAATVIVFELTGSYAWAVLSMICVVTAAQVARSFAGRSLFDRQLTLRGVKVGDDYGHHGGESGPQHRPAA